MQAVPSVIGIIIISFVLTRAMPGDPAVYFAGAMADEQSIAEVRKSLGLDKGWPEQFVIYVGNHLSLNMGWAILNTKGLSFIGLGVRPSAAEWGGMVAEGANYIVSGEWWLALFPGAVLMIAVFCFNLMGDGLRDLVEPLRRT